MIFILALTITSFAMVETVPSSAYYDPCENPPPEFPDPDPMPIGPGGTGGDSQPACMNPE